MNRFIVVAYALGILCTGTMENLRADDGFRIDAKNCYEPVTRKRSVWAGFGHLSARANEYVYGGPGGRNGDQLSHLIWDVNNALTLNVGLEGEINDRWNLFAEGVVSLGKDDSHMVDYDWLRPTTDWSHRSDHPNTDLNHYVQIDLGLDFKIVDSDCFALMLRGGFRYTDISFDAYGGTYVYSTGGFRDDVGTFPNIPGISYRQKLPGLYLGPRLAWMVNERICLKAGGLAGITLGPEARDHHWMRQTLFVDRMDGSAFYGANLGIDYSVSDCAVLYVEGNYDRYTTSKGYTEITSPFGAGVTPDGSAGADLETTQVKVGMRLNRWCKPLPLGCLNGCRD